MKHAGKMTLIFLGVLIPIQVLILTWWLPGFLSLSGGIPNLDSRFSYSHQETIELVSLLNDDGRQWYKTGSAIDMVYALAMAGTVTGILLLLTRRFPLRKQKIHLLVPGLYLMADWGENVLIWIFLNMQEPHRLPPILTRSASLLTSSKQVTAAIAVVSILFLSIRMFRLRCRT